VGARVWRVGKSAAASVGAGRAPTQWLSSGAPAETRPGRWRRDGDASADSVHRGGLPCTCAEMRFYDCMALYCLFLVLPPCAATQLRVAAAISCVFSSFSAGHPRVVLVILGHVVAM